MIHFSTGNILESHAEALVNTVNLAGVMGKGIALQFKKQFPSNYIHYKQACKEKRIAIGKLFITKESTLSGEKLIINFPTKTDWRLPSEYSFITAGLADLKRVIEEYSIKSIAIPPLGAGNGGLNWTRVKKMIIDELSLIPIDVYIYEPCARIIEQSKKERVRLTDARALLLYVLFDLVQHGEYVSEFSSEKICYFLQRFGAAGIFNLHYEPKYYGPYSGKVRYVLYALNGSYIMGYSNMDKKPFEPISIVADAYDTVKSHIFDNDKLKCVAESTMSFLDGFYSDFGLELLSSVDYLMCTHGDVSTNEIYKLLSSWSHRKETLFGDLRFVDIAKDHLKSHFSY